MENKVRNSYLSILTDAVEKEKSIILTGARQVGKTTLLKIVKQQQENKTPCLYLNCEEYFSERFSNLKEFCTRIKTEFNFDVYQKGILMLDEIQVWNDPDRLLKSYHDNTDIKATIIATGSRFRGQKTLGSSMVGRGLKIQVFCYSFEEYLEVQGLHIKNMEDISYAMIQEYLKTYLTWGGYPAVVHASTAEEKREKIQDILFSWIQKDFGYFLDNKFRAEFLNLMKYIAHNTGSLAKIEQFGQHIGLGRKTVEDMISFMEESFIISKVLPYFTDKSKEYNALPKIYFHDIGILHFLTGIFEATDFDGKITETFVQNILHRSYKQGSVFYYKKKNLSEIDFIFEKHDGTLIPIEVKTGDRTHIPEIFYRFNEIYHNKVQKYIQTTKSIEKEVEINPNIFLIPFWKIKI